MYAITGITGQVGGAVARKLLAEGANVRAVARDTQKAAQWVERGCELAIAEMSDAPALARGFAGADGMFVLIPPLFVRRPVLPRPVQCSLPCATRWPRRGLPAPSASRR